ncbi:MAG: hypothetical protein LBJ96_04560 [Holosporaceae bacterium]|jgi:hypothetical protein|nr:hypothetical protein [Holosporaceae bacterium]
MRKPHNANCSSFSPDITDEKREKLIEKFGKCEEISDGFLQNCLHGMTPMEHINSTYGRHGQSHMS